MISTLSMNVVECITRVRRMLGDSDSTVSPYWTDIEISRLISDSYREFCRETKAVEAIHTIGTTAGTAEYALPATAFQVIRVMYDGRKVYSTTKWELDRTEEDWENQTGYVSSYMIGQQNTRTLRLYKAPEQSTGVKALGEGELGVIIDVEAAGDTYTFSSELGVIADTDAAPWDGVYSTERGEVVYIDSAVGALQVWTKEVPLVWGLFLGTNIAEPMLLPHWSRLGVCYLAAAKALQKRGEQGNNAAASLYVALAEQHVKALKALVGRRRGNQVWAMGTQSLRGVRKPLPWDQTIEES